MDDATTVNISSNCPVFIVGSYRSGSTLLRVLLGAHERLCCPPESKVLLGLSEALGYPEVGRALKGMGLGRATVTKYLGTFVNSLFQECAGRESKSRWIDKTPNYFRLIPFIDELFEGNVLYLTIIRHPLDCVASLEEFMAQFQHHEDADIADHIKRYGSDRSGWAHLWKIVYDRLAFARVSRMSRFHIVKYEDLVFKTESTLKDILTFLGEQYSPSMIDRAFKTVSPAGIGDPKIRSTRRVHANSVGRWQEWEEMEIDALWAIVSETAHKYDYAI
jgi:hypothetical protein